MTKSKTKTADWQGDILQLRSEGPKHILFMCVANSARSQMAEGIARALAPGSVRVSSAGSKPARLNPVAVKVLGEIGIDISGQWSKGVEKIDAEAVDAVITLCIEEVCPIFPKPVTKVHWGLQDPVADGGDDEETLRAFRDVRDTLKSRLEELFKEWKP